MPARNKETVSKTRQPRPELSIRPRRGPMIIILVLCLVILAVISRAASATFLNAPTNGIASQVLFALLYLVGSIYVLGIGWSALRLLTDSRPSLQTNEEGLTLRHLPFLGTISVPWSAVKSIHAARSLRLTHLCIVPTDTHQFLSRHNLLLLALNASTRPGIRTSTVLSISQNALQPSIQTLVKRITQDYEVQESSGTSQATR
ncbi:MAG TPA: PH domain-containing protein [Ktedonobacteraceae bacterium]